MNKFLYGLVALTAIVLAGCGEQVRIRDDFRLIASSFADPPSAYRCMPLWVWNGTVTVKM